MPTYAEMAALYPDMETVIGVKIYKKRRIDQLVWTQAAAPNSNCWWIDHETTAIGASECNITTGVIRVYSPVASLVDCNATAGRFFYDVSARRLYIHMTVAANPNDGNYYIISLVAERVATDEVEIEESPGNFYPYQGLLQSAQIPDITSEISGMQRGGVAQAFGQIAANNDGHYDADLYDYIYEAAEVDCYFIGTARGVVSDAMAMWTGWTGRVEWTDLQIFISIEDLRSVTDSAYHGDVHADFHNDTAHSDVAHEDVAHEDSHSDVAHADVPHGDVAHEDVAHQDSHTDAHSDVAHEDVAHVDDSIPHTDSHSDEHVDRYDDIHEDTHSDTAHEDTHTDTYQDEEGPPHQDRYVDSHDDVFHSDTHGDVPHSDFYDDTHLDSHQDTAYSHYDTPHSDVAHSDSHSDTAHADVAHSNVAHSDSHYSDVAHADVPHGDVAHEDVAHQDISHSDEHGDAHTDET